eukprot:1094725-Pelagomonas_calceolata.AAC.1
MNIGDQQGSMGGRTLRLLFIPTRGRRAQGMDGAGLTKLAHKTMNRCVCVCWIPPKLGPSSSTHSYDICLLALQPKCCLASRWLKLIE